jgi:hypothetical protein
MQIFTDVIKATEQDLPFGRPFKCDHCRQLVATKRVSFQDAMIGAAGQVNLLLCDDCSIIDGQKVVTGFLRRRNDEQRP